MMHSLSEIVTFLRDMLVPPEVTPYEKTSSWLVVVGEQVSDGGSDTEPSSPSLVAAGPWGCHECFFSFFGNKGKDEI